MIICSIQSFCCFRYFPILVNFLVHFIKVSAHAINSNIISIINVCICSFFCFWKVKIFFYDISYQASIVFSIKNIQCGTIWNFSNWIYINSLVSQSIFSIWCINTIDNICIAFYQTNKRSNLSLTSWIDKSRSNIISLSELQIFDNSIFCHAKKSMVTKCFLQRACQSINWMVISIKHCTKWSCNISNWLPSLTWQINIILQCIIFPACIIERNPTKVSSCFNQIWRFCCSWTFQWICCAIFIIIIWISCIIRITNIWQASIDASSNSPY